jgi:hypothetical protein
MAKPKTVNIHKAKTHFSKLLKRVERGDEVISRGLDSRSRASAL